MLLLLPLPPSLSVNIKNIQCTKATIRNHVMLMFKLEITISCACTEKCLAMLHVLYGFAVRIHVASRKAGQKKKKKMLKKKSMFIQHACFVSDSSTNSVFALAGENALNNYLIRVVSLISMQNANVLHGNAYACTPQRTHYLAEELRFYQSHSICSLHRAHILDIDID